jgi:hypothetical protein
LAGISLPMAETSDANAAAEDEAVHLAREPARLPLCLGNLPPCLGNLPSCVAPSLAVFLADSVPQGPRWRHSEIRRDAAIVERRVP